VELGLVLTRSSRNEKTKEGEEDAQGVTMLLAALAVMATLFAAVAYEIILLNSVTVGDARKRRVVCYSGNTRSGNRHRGSHNPGVADACPRSSAARANSEGKGEKITAEKEYKGWTKPDRPTLI
jgi:hypothetical protein